MARGDLKTGRSVSRTPFQILADYYQTGDTGDRDLCGEYSGVTRSLAAVRWSRCLRAVILDPADEPERTDNELAADSVGGSLIAVVPLRAWSRIRTAGLELAALIAAEGGGLAAVNALFTAATYGQALSPPEARRIEHS